MTDTTLSAPVSASGQGAAEFSKLQIFLVILALACGGFGIGTGEFAIMGFLPDVGLSFGVSTPEAGYVISAYALGVVVGAPVIAALAARVSRRNLLLVLMAVFAAGNLLSAFAPDFKSFFLLRFLTGLPHGAYFGVAALVAASMVSYHMRARSVGWVMLGLTIATLAGTPLAQDGDHIWTTPYDNTVLVMPGTHNLKPGGTAVRLGRFEPI